jgi:hypothetical protein
MTDGKQLQQDAKIPHIHSKIHDIKCRDFTSFQIFAAARFYNSPRSHDKGIRAEAIMNCRLVRYEMQAVGESPCSF